MKRLFSRAHFLEHPLWALQICLLTTLHTPQNPVDATATFSYILYLIFSSSLFKHWDPHPTLHPFFPSSGLLMALDGSLKFGSHITTNHIPSIFINSICIFGNHFRALKNRNK